MKRISFITVGLSILAVFILIITNSPAHAFSDADNSPYKEAIEYLRDIGVIEGYESGEFLPLNGINRAEFLKIVLEARGDEDFSGSDCFPDVTDQWFAKYVCTAADEDIVEGYPDGTFKPENAIVFAEASKMIALAFKQEMLSESPDWYEPFVRALESSKAIPQTVDRLEDSVTREEMSEMIWRLAEGKDDQPSKGYINVKYPDVTVDLGSDEPQRAQSCTDLMAFANEARRSGVGGGGRGGMWMEESIGMPMMRTMDMEMAAPAAAPNAGAAMNKAASDDFSQTNVQVQGVDEADIVKTDGEYLYTVANQEVRIVRIYPTDQMELVGTVDLSDENFSPSELYIDGDRLVLIGSRWMQYEQPVRMMEKMAMPAIWPPQHYGGPRAEVRIYDVSDRADPKQVRRVTFEGNTISSRRIDDKLYLVVNQSTPWIQPLYRGNAEPTTSEPETLLPVYEDTAKTDGEVAVARCGDVMILPRVPSPQYLTVAVVPIDDTNADVQREVILGNAQNVYMSLDNLFIASTEWRYHWGPVLRVGGGEVEGDEAKEQNREKTNVYRFAVTDSGLEMKDQGSVPGRILNQFSMDEYKGHFRIATTVGNMWDESNPSENNLYILDIDDMNQVGEIEEIAPGEQIYSTRFVGDRVYMVTFKNIDPFFVIDASDPTAPRILGKLKIPGYSDYLHPYDDNHVIGFGKDAVESKDRENFAWYQGMKIALFDVTDVQNPTEMSKIIIGDRGTTSPLLQNHKALLFDKSRNLLSFPVTIHEISENEKSGDNPSAYGSPVFQGALVYDISLRNGFKELGRITHYEDDSYMKAGDYWYNRGSDIQRILRVDSSLLTISDGAVQSHHYPTVDKEGEVEFEGNDQSPPSVYPTEPALPEPFFEDEVME